MRTRVMVESSGRKFDVDKVKAKAKKVCPKAEKMDIYIKPEEGRAYYVIDGKTYGDDCYIEL